MGMMNDKISYFDESDKSKGYNVKTGKKVKKTGLLEDVTSKRGRVWVKKN
jgi:cytochrome c-type biogenesis protein CcmE